MVIWINKFNCSNAHLSWLNKCLCSQEPLSSVQVNQSPERKPERTGMLSSLASLITVSPQHQSPPPLKDQDPKHFKDIEWIGVPVHIHARGVFLCYAERWDMGERARAITVMYIIEGLCGRGWSSFLCRCKLTFICQGPIHKNISFMIASGTSPMQWQTGPTKSTINEPKRNIFTWSATRGPQFMCLLKCVHVSLCTAVSQWINQYTGWDREILVRPF